MSLKFADMSMSDHLLKIWLDAFPDDSKEDVELFFSKFLKPDKCAVWVENGIPVSMTFMLPAKLIVKEQTSLELIYIYAAATLTEYRGRGIFGTLLKKVHEALREKSIDACFLHPATSSLYDYYKRLGYKTYFRVCTDTINPTKLNDNKASMKLAETRGFNSETRNKLLAEYPVWVSWPDELVSLAGTNAELSGGAVVEVEGGLAICEPFENKLFIREWLCKNSSEKLLLQAVSSRFPNKKIIIRRPVNSKHRDRGSKFGMICPLNSRAAEIIDNTSIYSPYMGLAFD
jgi:hypothetical protein